MLNEKQPEILRQGVRVWNEWRDEDDDVVIEPSARMSTQSMRATKANHFATRHS